MSIIRVNLMVLVTALMLHYRLKEWLVCS